MFIPKTPEKNNIWVTVRNTKYFKDTTDIDLVFYNDHLEDYLIEERTKKIYFYSGKSYKDKYPDLPN